EIEEEIDLEHRQRSATEALGDRIADRVDRVREDCKQDAGRHRRKARAEGAQPLSDGAASVDGERACFRTAVTLSQRRGPYGAGRQTRFSSSICWPTNARRSVGPSLDQVSRKYRSQTSTSAITDWIRRLSGRSERTTPSVMPCRSSAAIQASTVPMKLPGDPPLLSARRR